MAIAAQEAGGGKLANRADHRIPLGGVLGVGGKDSGQLALAEAGRMLGEDEAQGGALQNRVLVAGKEGSWRRLRFWHIEAHFLRRPGRARSDGGFPHCSVEIGGGKVRPRQSSTSSVAFRGNEAVSKRVGPASIHR